MLLEVDDVKVKSIFLRGATKLFRYESSSVIIVSLKHETSPNSTLAAAIYSMYRTLVPAKSFVSSLPTDNYFAVPFLFAPVIDAAILLNFPSNLSMKFLGFSHVLHGTAAALGLEH